MQPSSPDRTRSRHRLRQLNGPLISRLALAASTLALGGLALGFAVHPGSPSVARADAPFPATPAPELTVPTSPPSAPTTPPPPETTSPTATSRTSQQEAVATTEPTRTRTHRSWTAPMEPVPTAPPGFGGGSGYGSTSSSTSTSTAREGSPCPYQNASSQDRRGAAMSCQPDSSGQLRWTSTW